MSFGKRTVFGELKSFGLPLVFGGAAAAAAMPSAPHQSSASTAPRAPAETPNRIPEAPNSVLPRESSHFAAYAPKMFTTGSSAESSDAVAWFPMNRCPSSVGIH